MWTLITVTYGGEVGHSRGYPTKALCEQARSVALTGMTIEQNTAADEARAAWETKQRDDWRAAHPPRTPTTKADFKLVDNYKRYGGRTLGATGPYSNVGDDGLIYDYPGDHGLSWTSGPNDYPVDVVRGQIVRRQRDDIKYAECVLTEMPAAEAA